MSTDLSLSADAAAAMSSAGEEARKAQHEFISPEHMLLAMLGGIGAGAGVSDGVGAAMERHHLKPAKLLVELAQRVAAGPDEVAPGELPLSPEGRGVLAEAAKIARRRRRDRVGAADLLEATLNRPGLIAQAIAAAR